MLYDLIFNKCLRFFIQVLDTFNEVWNWSFKIDFLDFHEVITFPSILTTLLITLLGFYFIKKFVPLA